MISDTGRLLHPNHLSQLLGDPVASLANWRCSIWRPATERAGVDSLRFDGLRHFYASLLIDHGEPVEVVRARLGHASASETLDTYAHLWPDKGERTRAAVDEVLGHAGGSTQQIG